MTAPVIAEVQVARHVRRPVHADTFLAVDITEDEQSMRVRGHWRGHDEVRVYRFPLRSVVAVRLLEATS